MRHARTSTPQLLVHASKHIRHLHCMHDDLRAVRFMSLLLVSSPIEADAALVRLALCAV